MRNNLRPSISLEEGLPVIKAVQLEVVHFFDKKQVNGDGTIGREIILLYSLGEDGVVREFSNGVWVAFPITGKEKVI